MGEVMDAREEREELILPVMADEDRREMLRLEEVGGLPTQIDRSRDLFFRFLLGCPSRLDLLGDLLNALFSVRGCPRVEQLELRNADLPPDGVNLKESRLDIAVVDELGRHLNVELQRENHKHFIPRGLFYLDKLFIEPLGNGEDYGRLRPTIVICLLAFDLFQGEDRCVWGFRWMSPEGKLLTDVQQLFYVEMNKARERLSEIWRRTKSDPDPELTDEERLRVWCGYMTNDALGVRLVQEVLTKDKVFRKVNAAEQSYWGTPEYRYYQLRAQMAEMDRKAIEETHLDEATARGRAEGRAEGMAEGVAKGRLEGRLETARRMLAHGLAPEQIAEYTDLSLDEIKTIRARMSG